MFCKVRNYQLIPDKRNPGKPKKSNQNMNHMIYDETMYFPIKFQQEILNNIQAMIRRYPNIQDQEKTMNFFISAWKQKYQLTTLKPLFPKENLGVLIGDPFYHFY